MTGRLVVLAELIALSAAIASSASAQTVHGGVDVASLVPPTMEITDVVVPDREVSPVRLALASQSDGPTELLIDVWVAADRPSAQGHYAHALDSLTTTVPEARGLGDRGVAVRGFAAFVRDNVAVAVRHVSGAHDVIAFARHLDRAIIASPSGSPRMDASLQLPDLDAMAPGDRTTIVLPSWALGATFTARGGASVRRTRRGWLLSRTGSGSAALEAHVVDLRLRTIPR